MAGITIQRGDTLTLEFIGTTLSASNGSEAIACDLKGNKGDMGIRGPQAAAHECEVTQQEFNALEERVSTLEEGGGSVGGEIIDTSNLVTKYEFNLLNKTVDILEDMVTGGGSGDSTGSGSSDGGTTGITPSVEVIRQELVNVESRVDSVETRVTTIENAGGTVDTSNLVTLNSNQTITAPKTFNSNIIFNGMARFNSSANTAVDGVVEGHVRLYKEGFRLHNSNTETSLLYFPSPANGDGTIATQEFVNEVVDSILVETQPFVDFEISISGNDYDFRVLLPKYGNGDSSMWGETPCDIEHLAPSIPVIFTMDGDTPAAYKIYLHPNEGYLYAINLFNPSEGSVTLSEGYVNSEIQESTTPYDWSVMPGDVVSLYF